MSCQCNTSDHSGFANRSTKKEDSKCLNKCFAVYVAFGVLKLFFPFLLVLIDLRQRMENPSIIAKKSQTTQQITSSKRSTKRSK